MGQLHLEIELTLADKLRARVEHRQALIAERDRIIAELGVVSDDLAREMALADQKRLRVGPHLLLLVENPGRITLDKHRLVELGVSPDVIIEASVRGPSSISLQVKKASD